MRVVRSGIIVVATSALFVGATVAPAEAQRQDGLVNVMIGDVTIQDVNVAVIANVVANVCDAVDVGPIAAGVLGRARAVDNSGRDQTVCTAGTEEVILTQN